MQDCFHSQGGSRHAHATILKTGGDRGGETFKIHRKTNLAILHARLFPSTVPQAMTRGSLFGILNTKIRRLLGVDAVEWIRDPRATPGGRRLFSLDCFGQRGGRGLDAVHDVMLWSLRAAKLAPLAVAAPSARHMHVRDFALLGVGEPSARCIHAVAAPAGRHLCVPGSHRSRLAELALLVVAALSAQCFWH